MRRNLDEEGARRRKEGVGGGNSATKSGRKKSARGTAFRERGPKTLERAIPKNKSRASPKGLAMKS